MTLAQIKELQQVKQREVQSKIVQNTKKTVWVQLLQDRYNDKKWCVLKYYKNGRHYTMRQYIMGEPVQPRSVRVHAKTAHHFLTSYQFI